MSKVGEVWAIVSIGMGTDAPVEVIGAATSLAVAKNIVEDKIPRDTFSPKGEAKRTNYSSEVESSSVLFDYIGNTTYLISKVDVVD